MTGKTSDCCCCDGCVNNGSLVPACTYCAGVPATGTATSTASSGGVVPLFYEVDLSWIGVVNDLLYPPCCPAGLSTNEQIANTGACTWTKTFTCDNGPPTVQGRVTLTLNSDGTASLSIEINYSGTAWTTLGIWSSFGLWRCLCANWMYLDLTFFRSNPPPPGCELPRRICVRPVGDCCANDRPVWDQLPSTLYAVLVNEEQCANLDGLTIPLTWDPVAYEFSILTPTPAGADCTIDYIKMRCTNFQGGGFADWEMDIQWTRTAVTTVTQLAWPADVTYAGACYPFDTKFTEILSSFLCCSGPVGTASAFAPRLSVRVIE